MNHKSFWNILEHLPWAVHTQPGDSRHLARTLIPCECYVLPHAAQPHGQHLLLSVSPVWRLRREACKSDAT